MRTTVRETLFSNIMLDPNRQREMVFYGRVSTQHEAQLVALENQMKWYEDQMKYHPNWNLVERYIDEGITGTLAAKRPEDVYKRQAALQSISADLDRSHARQ